jgi:hypothetical protein
MFDQFAAARSTSATPRELLARLDGESSPTTLIELLDELAARAEEAIRDERPAVAMEIFHRIVLRERDAHEFEVKRAFVLTVKRLTKPALLKAVVRELTHEGREAALVVLGRTGEDGADAVIEQLAAGREGTNAWPISRRSCSSRPACRRCCTCWATRAGTWHETPRRCWARCRRGRPRSRSPGCCTTTTSACVMRRPWR